MQTQQKNPYKLWQLPEKNEDSFITGLKVQNSLCPEQLVEFVPQKGKKVKFYNCGPTVYDASHLGHARTYVGVDMIRKVLTRYFGYDVFFCQNVTDIDDKIIDRSNQLKQDFAQFARKWEMDYWEDMLQLNVDKPDVIVRVSEYVPEIITFIQKIITNGFAYESNSSVYFDVEKFHNTSNQCYAKLEPQSVNNKQKLEDGEGALGVKNETEKRSPKDFALWKASKPGEPEWDSPWGKGRPGWHIECSTMASEILGYPLDIHMGGEDLKFPHHDNEIAQSEAYFNKDKQNQWVNYFLHTGHLHIEGLKMSKSLKNFITIKNLLSKFSVRVLRLIFCKQNYDSLMDYTEASLDEAKAKDKKFSEFFLTINAVLLQGNLNTSQKWGAKEFALNDLFGEKQASIHKHFQNNIAIPKVIGEIEEIIKAVNVYLKEKPYITPLLQSISNYVKYIFHCIGISYESNTSSSQEDTFISLINEISSFRDQVRGSGQDFEKIVEISKTYQQKLESFVQKKGQSENSSQAFDIAFNFFDGVQKAAQEKSFKNIMQICDIIRDEKLINLGVRIDDGKPGEQSLWKIDDKEVLLKEREEKIKKIAQQQEALKKKEEEKIKQMSVNPTEMFKNDPKYKGYQFDEKGIPSHDEKGQVLKDKALQSFQKKWDAQNALYQQYLEKYENKK